MYFADIKNTGIVLHEMKAPECKGRSETVPNAAISLVELYKRSVLGQVLPDVQFPLETGDDEEFEDAFESSDIIDMYDNAQKIGYLQEKISKQEKLKKAKQAANEMKSEAKAEESLSDDILP